MDDFTDDELLDELRDRGLGNELLDLNTHGVDSDTMRELLNSIYEKRRLGKDFAKELDDMIYYGLGRVL
jgi:hypothetical protein